jgi:glycosyltransferase involved in cell wall biosynthesis
MKLLYLNHNVVRKGGTYFRAFHAARYLARRGHDVTLLSIAARQRTGFSYERDADVTIIHTPDLLWGVGRTGWDLWDTLCRIGVLHPHHWDIVHAWDCRPVVILPALYARQRSRGCGGKLVIDWCDWWGRGGTQAERPGGLSKRLYAPVETFFEEAFRTQADATTVASTALRERALALGVPAEPLLVMPGGSDTETIRPLEKGGARAALNLRADAYIVGYMGALPRGEVDLLLDALHHARRELSKLYFLAIGVSVAGSGLTLREAAGERWADWMIETGRVPFGDVGTYLAACDALALPMRDNISNRARWPSKLNDYLAAGRPVVATLVGEVAGLAHHRFGVFGDDTPAAMARGFLQLANTPLLATECSRNARALAEGPLNWNTIVGQLEELYRQALD